MHAHLFRLDTKSRHWYAQVYTPDGKRRRFSCRTRDKGTARKFAERRLRELEEAFDRGLAGLPDPVSLRALLDRYQRDEVPKLRPATQTRTLAILAHARARLPGDRLLTHLTPHDILTYLDGKRAEGVSARTVNYHRAVLHRIFALAVRPWGLIPSNPVAQVEPLRHEPREPRVLTESEYGRLRTACAGNRMLTAFVVLAWETGGRAGELLALQWDDVDLANRLVTFRNDAAQGRRTKGRRSRTVPLSEAATRLLRDHAAAFRFRAPTAPWLFKHLRANRGAAPGDRIESMYRVFKRAAARAGIPDVSPHSLRHAFATRAIAAGHPLQLVQAYLGHATPAMTWRYTHLVPEHLRAVVAAPAEAASR